MDAGGAPGISPLPDSHRDQKFSKSFDRVFQSDGIQIVRTPFRAPQANGVAERFVRTVRAECLDWLLILNGQHLEQVVRVFIDHYNGYRRHRSLALAPPAPVRLPPGEWSGASYVAIDLVQRFTSTPSRPE